MPAAGVEDQRRLDPCHAGPVGQAVEGEVLEVPRIPDDDMDHHVVASADQPGRAHLRHIDEIVHERVDRAALVFRQLDHEQCLQSDAERLRIDFGVGAQQHAALAQAANALMRARRGKADPGGDLLDREPGIVLQKPQDADIGSVEVRVSAGSL